MKKIALLCLALILALGGLGVGYAAWTDTVTIDGTVATGEVCIEFVSCDLTDEAPYGGGGGPPYGKPVNPGGDYPTVHPDDTCYDGFEYNPDLKKNFWPIEPQKNVGWGEQLIGNDPNLSGDNDLLEVWLYNTYPSYFNRLTFYVYNCGSIPVKINEVWIDGTPIRPTDLIRFDFNTGAIVVNPDITQPNLVWDFEVYWGNAIGVQIEPGEPQGHEVSLWMHVLQPCPQSQLDTQHFTITLKGVQWNEY
ncbi:hypothetical protein ES703_14444 [subsurface metagenome]